MQWLCKLVVVETLTIFLNNSYFSITEHELRDFIFVVCGCYNKNSFFFLSLRKNEERETYRNIYMINRSISIVVFNIFKE